MTATLALFTVLPLAPVAAPLAVVAPKPICKRNVLLIACADLNNYVRTSGGHPQVQTAHMTYLIQSRVSFRQAHSNRACRAKRDVEKARKAST